MVCDRGISRFGFGPGEKFVTRRLCGCCHIPGCSRTEDRDWRSLRSLSSAGGQLDGGAKCASAIEQTIVHFGHIDVVVNNAGYGQLGTLEELTDREARANFEVNVFGALHVIRNVMPYLRQQRSGKLFNISSIGGLFGSFPGWGIYCATKFAMAGCTEALAEEVRAFGITATVIYPGYFRTNFLSKGSVRTAQAAMQGYETARQSEQAPLDSIHGTQRNKPDKAAAAVLAVAKEENPPGHLLLGVDTIDMLNAKLERLDSDIKA